MNLFNKLEKKVVKPVYKPINNDPCELLDELRPLSVSEQVKRITSISSKFNLTRRQELADLRGVSINVDPDDFETPLDTYKNPSLVDVRNASDELSESIKSNLQMQQTAQKAHNPDNEKQKQVVETSAGSPASSAEGVSVQK